MFVGLSGKEFDFLLSKVLDLNLFNATKKADAIRRYAFLYKFTQFNLNYYKENINQTKNNGTFP